MASFQSIPQKKLACSEGIGANVLNIEKTKKQNMLEQQICILAGQTTDI